MNTRFPREILEQRLSVPFDYPVVFTRGLFHPEHPLLAEVVDREREGRRHRIQVCLDAGAAQAIPDLADRIARYASGWPQQIEIAGPVATLAGGEQAKSGLPAVQHILELLHARRLDRQSFVLAVGGGSLLDAVGFAASLVHRGLRVIRVPTTVEAQNDVGVGVKTGIDAFGVKNFLGTFAPPFAVLNDFDFLDALPLRDWISGIAEAFKVAAIKDRTFFDVLCDSAPRLAARDRRAMEGLVVRCARLHLDHIREGGDPFEMGTARPLDYGHWSSHQLEVMSDYAIKHGEAVAIGIALDAFVAQRLGFIARVDFDRLVAGLRACGLPVWDARLERRSADGSLAILEGLERFREHLGGPLTITLPAPIGGTRNVHSIDPAVLAEGIGHLKAVARTA
jgi:3-dehydroquinate synthase